MSEELRIVVDAEAAIVPGESAAGIRLGDPIAHYCCETGNALLKLDSKERKDETGRVDNSGHDDDPSDALKVFRSDMVDLWLKGGVISQIGLHGSYKGAVENRLRLGDTNAQMVEAFGPCGDDDEDNLVIGSLPGLCVDSAHERFNDKDLCHFRNGHYTEEWIRVLRDSSIEYICVFSPLCYCGAELRNRTTQTTCPKCGLIVFEPIEF